MLFFVFLAVLLAFLFAFFILRGAALLELADFQGDLVSLTTKSDGQFGGATFAFRRWVQDLVRIAGFQWSLDVVAFLGVRQTSLFGAFNFGFEVIAISASFESTDEAISIAAVVVGLDSALEREFALGFALRGGRR